SGGLLVDWPKTDRLVLTGACQGLAVRRERDGANLGAVPLQDFVQFAGPDIPEAHPSVRPARGHELSVWRERDGARTALAALQRNELFSFFDAPDLDHLAAGTAGDHLAIW